MKTKEYRVIVLQVNQQAVYVRAKTPEEAQLKAERKWKRENGPDVIEVRPTRTS